MFLHFQMTLFCLLHNKKEDYLIIRGHLRALQNHVSLEIRVTVLLEGAEYCMEQKLTPRGWGMGSDLAVLPTKITHGMFWSLFFPSVNALLAVGMNIN